MPSNNVKVGDVVMSADGKDIGTVKQLGDTCFRIAAKHKRDFWLANDAVEGRDAGIAVLYFESNRLGNAAVDVSAHAGQHSHAKMPGNGPGMIGLMKPLVMLAGIGAVALKDPERRKQAISMAREGATKARTMMKKQQSSAASYGPSSPVSGYSGSSTYTAPTSVNPPMPDPPPMPMPSPTPDPIPTPPPMVNRTPTPVPAPSTQSGIRDRSAREESVIGEVTAAFPTMNLRVSPVRVHKLEGGEVDTLRFTLDETASSDIDVDRMEHSAEAEEILARELIEDLRAQLPPEAFAPR